MNEEIIKNSSFEPMGCREVGSFLLLFVLGGRGMTMDECAAVKHHLQTCSRCARAYKETGFVVSLLQSQQEILIEKGLFSRPVPEEIDREPAIEESFEEFQDKLQRSRARARRNIRARRLNMLLKTSAAVAACILIGLSIVFISSVKPRHNQSANVSNSSDISSAVASVKIELVSVKGKTLLPSGETIETNSNELKILLINDKHKMVLNYNTILAVEPLVENNNIGCLVKLASGQIYTHVKHDGNPFIVDTAHGEAVITSTTFDVKVKDSSTTLVVSEGTVQFESENGVVNVTAGQTSQIIDQAAPSRPILCNVTELTAWAIGYKAKPELAEDKSRSDIVEFLTLWPNKKEPPGLDEVDYDYWIKEKRNWFRLQFPQVFQLQHALTEEGIEVEYPELLIKSGDLWQFAYIKGWPDRFSVLSFDSLLKTASDYGFDKHWLLENVTAAKYALEKPVSLKNSLTALNAFGQWNSSFENAQKSSDWVDYDDLYSLFHASVYLTETRSLLWFAVRDGQYDLTDKERAEVLALLQREVNAASICQENALHQPYKKKQLCEPVARKEDKWYKWADVIIKNIKAITNIKEKIAEYENGK